MDDPSASFIIQKLLVAARKLKPSQDVRLLITKAILYKISDAITYTVSRSFDRVMFKSMCLLAFYAFLIIGEITSGQNISNKTLLFYHQICIEKHKITISLTHKHHMGKPFFLTVYSANYSNRCAASARSPGLRENKGSARRHTFLLCPRHSSFQD